MADERIVIVGGGFAGVTLAVELEKRIPDHVEIVVLGRDNHFVFTSFLPEVAGRTISPLHVVVPGREMTKQTSWLAAEALSIDREKSEITHRLPQGRTATLSYTHLVLACGSGVDLNAVPGMSMHSLPLKSVGDAIAMGNQLIQRFEQAALETDPARRQQLLTVVVVGAGFSGVEIGGHLFDLMQRIHHFYPPLAAEKPRLIMLQRGNEVLPELQHDSLSKYAADRLKANGIDLRLGTEAQEVTVDSVILKSGERLSAGMIVCTIGTTTNPLVKNLGLPLEKGRLPTGGDMRAHGTHNVWALGDCALVPNAYNDQPSAPTAQFALRQAQQMAKNFDRLYADEPTRPFRFHPQGLLASIGHKKGVAEVYSLQFSGLLAFMFWRAVYLWKMPTFSRKFQIAVDWLWEALFPPNAVTLNLEAGPRVKQAHYAAGDYVYRKGEPGVSFFAISKGTVAVYLNEGDPPVARLRDGDHFGESALLAPDQHGKQVVSVRAETPLDVVVMDRADLQNLSASLGILRKDFEKVSLVKQAYRGLMERVQREPEFAKLTVHDTMDDAQALPLSLSLTETAKRFAQSENGYPVVEEDGSLRGYVRRSDLYSALSRNLPPETPLAVFMQTDPPSISADRPVLDATIELLRSDLDRLPVISADGKRQLLGSFSPLGVFSRTAR